ncbi:hypothetical protein [Sporosarcina ureilytica]|nr:hypothetical protein [Sporosarcina ureilytica]
MKRDKKKYETALNRLEDLYLFGDLFGDEGISQKDYILRNVTFN